MLINLIQNDLDNHSNWIQIWTMSFNANKWTGATNTPCKYEFFGKSFSLLLRNAILEWLWPFNSTGSSRLTRNSNDFLDFSQYQHIVFNGCSSSLIQVITETTLGILCTCTCGHLLQEWKISHIHVLWVRRKLHGQRKFTNKWFNPLPYEERFTTLLECRARGDLIETLQKKL